MSAVNNYSFVKLLCKFFYLFSLRDVIFDNQLNLLEQDLGFDVVLFNGILHRKARCKMKTLDLQGLKLSKFKSNN